jgi:hypothetical protein
MDKPNATMAQQIAQAAGVFWQRRTRGTLPRYRRPRAQHNEEQRSD